MDAFTALVLHAHRNEWCWKLFCTTCGHSLYLAGLLAIIRGQHPFNDSWIIHDADYFLSNPYPDRSIPISLQKQILSMVAQADLEHLLKNCGSEYTLASLGVVLYHCSTAEENDATLSEWLNRRLRGISRREELPNRWTWDMLSHLLKYSPIFGQLAKAANIVRR